MARNLIIGAIEGYGFEQIAPFFLTLRKVNYAGETVIFHRRIDASSLERLADLGVHLIALPPQGLRNPATGRLHAGQGRFGDVLSISLRALRALPVSPAKKEAWALRLAKRFFHIANLRFVIAEQYLRERLGAYDHVMISDVRDVLFQADPFDFEGAGELTTFLEGPGFTIDTCRNYREWIEAAFGAAEVAQFRTVPLSCCAITIGPATAMLGYLAAMAGLIRGNRTREPYLFGLDSAAHNYLCFHRQVTGLVLRENLSGPVAHLGAVEPEDLRFNEGGLLLNVRGEVVNIVHQYDRHRSSALLAGKGEGC
jgi:hypothetical protein